LSYGLQFVGECCSRRSGRYTRRVPRRSFSEFIAAPPPPLGNRGEHGSAHEDQGHGGARAKIKTADGLRGPERRILFNALAHGRRDMGNSYDDIAAAGSHNTVPESGKKPESWADCRGRARGSAAGGHASKLHEQMLVRGWNPQHMMPRSRGNAQRRTLINKIHAMPDHRSRARACG